jgi:hypothetical protein
MAVIVHAGQRCVALVGLVGWVVEQWSIMWSGQYDMVCVLSDCSSDENENETQSSSFFDEKK